MANPQPEQAPQGGAPQQAADGGMNWRRWLIVVLAVLVVALIVAAIVK